MTLETWSVLAKLMGYRVMQGDGTDAAWYAWEKRACKGAWFNDSCCMYKPGKANSPETLIVNT